MADEEDELDIRSGGLIAVDTASLRHAAGVLERLSSDCDDLAALLWRAGELSRDAGLWFPDPAGAAEEARTRAHDLATALRHRAEVYELVELRALDALGAGTAGTASAQADALWHQWQTDRHREIEKQMIGATGWMVGAIFAVTGLTRFIGTLDRGVLHRDDPPLSPVTRPSVVTELSRETVSPPRTLEDIASRMPGDGESRVRVEAFATATGQQEYVAYIAGTQELGTPYAEPWDMASNLELYFGTASSSYDATVRALLDAGVQEGDRVHLAGHSQGGMIATRLAREGPFEVATSITFASPVEADLDDDVLAVTLRHRDDPIVALSDGGLPTVAGGSGSFVAERVADPDVRIADIGFATHQMDEYRETAHLVDASGDVRVEALHAQLAGIAVGAATTGTAVVYGARRDTGDVSGARGGRAVRAS